MTRKEVTPIVEVHDMIGKQKNDTAVAATAIEMMTALALPIPLQIDVGTNVVEKGRKKDTSMMTAMKIDEAANEGGMTLEIARLDRVAIIVWANSRQEGPEENRSRGFLEREAPKMLWKTLLGRPIMYPSGVLVCQCSLLGGVNDQG